VPGHSHEKYLMLSVFVYVINCTILLR